MVKSSSDGFLTGRKCIFCSIYKPYRLSDKRIKCRKCKAVYSTKKLKRDLDVLHYFCLELSARKAQEDLKLSYNAVTKRYMFFREKIADYSEHSSEKLKSELELGENYFGGKRKGNRGRGAFNKAIVFGMSKNRKRFLSSQKSLIFSDTGTQWQSLYCRCSRCFKRNINEHNNN